MLQLAFHTWAVRCATEIPDRVTDAALGQCAERHLQSLLGPIDPAVVVAMGGPTARYFWSRSGQTWDGFGPITALHGTTLSTELGGRTVPVILSVHPFQRSVDLRPEVIARAIAERISPDEFGVVEQKAA